MRGPGIGCDAMSRAFGVPRLCRTIRVAEQARVMRRRAMICLDRRDFDYSGDRVGYACARLSSAVSTMCGFLRNTKAGLVTGRQNTERSLLAMDHDHDADDFQLRKAGMVAIILVVSVFVVAMIGVVYAMGE